MLRLRPELYISIWMQVEDENVRFYLHMNGPTTKSTWEILATPIHVGDQKAGVRGHPEWHSFAVHHTRGILLSYSNI